MFSPPETVAIFDFCETQCDAGNLIFASGRMLEILTCSINKNGYRKTIR